MKNKHNCFGSHNEMSFQYTGKKKPNVQHVYKLIYCRATAKCFNGGFFWRRFYDLFWTNQIYIFNHVQYSERRKKNISHHTKLQSGVSKTFFNRLFILALTEKQEEK